MSNLSGQYRYLRENSGAIIQPVIKNLLTNWWDLSEADAATRADSHGQAPLSDNGGLNVGQRTLNGWNAADFKEVTSNGTTASNLYCTASTGLYEVAAHGGSFTLFGWVEHDELDVGHTYMAMADNNSTGFDDMSWQFWVNATDYPEMRVVSANASYLATFGSVIDTGNPHFVAAFWNRTTSQLGVSLDGGDWVTAAGPAGYQLDLDYDGLRVGRVGYNSGSRYYMAGGMARWGRCATALPIEYVRWLKNGLAGRTYAEVTA